MQKNAFAGLAADWKQQQLFGNVCHYRKLTFVVMSEFWDIL